MHDPHAKLLPVRRDAVLEIRYSINSQSVAVPGMPIEPSQAHLVVWQDGTIARAAVYLVYPGLGNFAAYRAQDAQPVERSKELAAAGVDFLEEMGFMVDDTAFSTLSPEDQKARWSQTPVFTDPELAMEVELDEVESLDDSPPEPRTTGDDALDRAALGRLLASF